jgi:putative endonuclease
VTGNVRLHARGDLGRRAELLASEVLEREGLQVVARNWRRPEGELDIVAAEQGVCVFVEVRSRTGEERGHPLESITPQKRARVIRAARLYLDAEAPCASAYRFDVVAVTFWDDGRSPDVVHVREAFEVGG